MARRLLPVIALALLPAALAWGQERDLPCPEFRVNTYTTSDQRAPDLASTADGSFLVVWQSLQDTDPARGVFAQRYDAGGVPQGGEFHVNTHTTGFQGYPRVAATAGGGFVVAWESDSQDGSGFGLFGQRLDAAGIPQGPEFPINTYTTGFQSFVSLAALPAGGFVATFTDYPRDDGTGVFGQRFDAAGNPIGLEFQVNSFTTGYQYLSDVAVNDSGGFVIVWLSVDQDGDERGVFGQRYDASGAPAGPEFQVNTFTTGQQNDPSVAYSAEGTFLVAWSRDAEGGGTRIVVREFNATGVPLGGEFPVTVDLIGSELFPTVVRDPLGGFVVTWENTYAGNVDLVGRRYHGGILGSEFQVNSYTAGLQFGGRLALTLGGGFVSAWTSVGQDGSLEGVYASIDCSRFYTVTPCRLLDTRIPPASPLMGGWVQTVPAGFPRCEIPIDARGVALNVTAVSPTDVGNLRFSPTLPMPLASTINFVPGRSRANNAVVPMGPLGQLWVQCDMPIGQTTHLVLDVYGYFKR